MEKQHVHINSKLYADLFSLGGDNLVAVYCMLKFSKNGEIYKELIPSFTTNIDTKKEVYKKKNYLQFDMIDFWINGAGK